jgi:nucleotide-binding universal stress UspA family protein
MLTLKRILVPHDFSETSDAAVKYAIALGRTFGASLLFLHVGDRARYDLETEFPLGLESELRDAMRERLQEILTPAEQAELMPDFDVRAGHPARVIVEYAKEREADLIVMGTHGRTMVSHAILGSVAENVVRIAECPVLTVRSSPYARVFPQEVPVRAVASALQV